MTDPATVPLLEAALGALGEPTGVTAFASAGDGAAAEAEREARRVLAASRPTHLVAIERPGRTRDGDSAGRKVRQASRSMSHATRYQRRRSLTSRCGSVVRRVAAPEWSR